MTCPQLGVDGEFTVTDELTGESYTWGQANYVRLDPATRPAHIFTVTPGVQDLGRDAPDRKTRRFGSDRAPRGDSRLVRSDQPRDPEWYKRAVFYEVLVRGFQDSNGDGTGDLRGLISRLDYLEWLGIDCIWLLPIYPSPLRDGGYDIADFMADPARVRQHRRLRRRWSTRRTSAASGSSPTWS